MRLNYDEAVSFLEENGVGCDPCVDLEGEYACDLLDDMPDGYDEFDEPYYTKSTLKDIIKRVKEYKEDMEDVDDDEDDD